MGIFSKLFEGLQKTRENFFKKIHDTFLKYKYISEDLYYDLEETLITSDISADLTFNFLEELREYAREKKISDASALFPALKEIMSAYIPDPESLNLDDSLNVILVVGVNGVGKTTTIGKLASQIQDGGKKVMLVAADTFRAAASEQLTIWSERVGCPIVKHQTGSDPAAVIFDAIHSARARNIDVLLIDTAGRLHNKANLMNELSKVNRILEREIPGAPQETLLVLDASTGQNGLHQARAFNEVCNLTGIVLTKMDGTAKGGIIFDIFREFNTPVKFVGVGEKIDDLMPFNKEEFVAALFDDME